MADYATLLRDHVTLTCRSVDRIFLQGYVPHLQTAGWVCRFLRWQRQYPIPSSAVFGKIGAPAPHRLIRRIPHSFRYQVTPDGIRQALFLTRLAQRLLIPGLAQLTDPSPPAPTRLQAAARAYHAAIDDLARQARLAA